jgi:hypothetical protein
MSAFVKGAIPSGSSYRLVVSPWGYVAQGVVGPTVLVTVDSVAPLAGAPTRGDLKGRLLLLALGARANQMMLTGGRYSAVVAFVLEGDRLVPEILKVSSVSG